MRVNRQVQWCLGMTWNNGMVIVAFSTTKYEDIDRHNEGHQLQSKRLVAIDVLHLNRRNSPNVQSRLPIYV